jgi:hypothetical protein
VTLRDAIRIKHAGRLGKPGKHLFDRLAGGSIVWMLPVGFVRPKQLSFDSRVASIIRPAPASDITAEHARNAGFLGGILPPETSTSLPWKLLSEHSRRTAASAVVSWSYRFEGDTLQK